MFKLRLLFMVIVGNWLMIANGAKDEMPIIAYWGVPERYISEANFRIFSECGFSVSLFPYSSLEKLVQACRYADKVGVKVLGRCPEMDEQPLKVANMLKNENGFFGYMMQDEPSVPEIQQQQKIMQQLKSVDNTHRFYINLLPYYNPDWIYPNTKVKTYTEYLKAASATFCQQLSFDFYPVTKDSIRSTWYYNLEMIRHESLVSGKPFWGFVLSVPHIIYPQPTMGSLRLQVYSNLGYGAQAIQYFTYWTPDKNDKYDFHNAPITPGGEKTETYALVQAMNSELKTVARLFYGAEVVSVGHLGVIDKGTTRQTVMPTNIKSLRVRGYRGAIISQLVKDGNRYLAIVNKDHLGQMELYIKARNNMPRHLTKTLQEQPMKTSYTIAAGDIVLFRLN